MGVYWLNGVIIFVISFFVAGCWLLVAGLPAFAKATAGKTGCEAKSRQPVTSNLNFKNGGNQQT
jgi:hypothetical protein